MSTIQQVINRILSDKKFRDALQADPSSALQEVGIKPTAEMLTLFERLSETDDSDANVFCIC
jgi:hypothetical protein